MQTWRLLDTPPMSAADNMALDETLVELRGEGKTPNTVRFLQFSPRSVLVGYHQCVAEEIRTSYCQEQGIEINRRVTGGGAIFFDENQLGWEVICDKESMDVAIPNERLFRKLCAPVTVALEQLGVPGATFRPRNDIEVDGRKISGTGGTESDGAFLFQGTMLVDFDVDTMLRALRIPVEKLKAKEIDSVRERVTCLAWQLGRVPHVDEIKAAIRHGFEQRLNIHLQPGGLTDEETWVFENKRAYFHSNQWIDSVQPKYRKRETVYSAYKSEAGMVRFTLSVNTAQRRLTDVYITGDFLSFPARSLYDLEAALRGRKLDRAALHDTIREFFEPSEAFPEGRMRIPGMRLQDFVKPLDQALEKVDITDFGLPLEHCNAISVANGTFADVAAKKPSVLLLPYCAKHQDCDLRYKKGCKMCGEQSCTTGPAWELARRRNMRVSTVVNFEDLWAELLRMKERGVAAYVGCCCQPFFAKHVDDFSKAELPGILVDIDNTTCYDLDEAKKAYAGRFENQTSLNLKLLESVLDAAGAGQNTDRQPEA